MSLSPLKGVALASILFILAVILTPPAGETAADGLAGFPRLVLYFSSALALVGSRPAERHPPTSRPDSLQISQLIPVLGDLTRRLAGPGPRLTLLGLTAAGVIAAGNGIRLIVVPGDPLTGPVWLATLALVALVVSPAPVTSMGWPASWPRASESGQLSARFQKRRWDLLLVLMLTAVAIRLPGLDVTPIGIHPDEGDRWWTAVKVLAGLASPNWFDSGWYYINMVYFRTLAIGIGLFGTSVGEARLLSAFVGLGVLGVIAWVGCRNFGWRLGLVATALATADAYLVQQSRFISEGGISALLWALTVAGFLEGGRRGQIWAFGLAGATGGLGLYFYPSSRLWVVGAALTIAVLWLAEPEHRWGIAGGAAVAAVVSLIAVTPFLTHIYKDPTEFTLRYLDTAVSQADRSVRLTYNHPEVSMPELLVLQAERTFGMFDRYSDGGSFLSLERPAQPQPLAGLTLVGIAYAAIVARRDPRYAILVIWFCVGMSGVLLTIDTPNYQRASGASLTFPFFSAFVIVEVAKRLGDGFARLPLHPLERQEPISDSDEVPARRSGVDAALAGGAALTIVVGAFLYFGPYRLAMQPRWAIITNEGNQVASLGRSGPVYALDAFDFQINSGWVRLLSQDATRGQVPNIGDQLPLLATTSVAPADRAHDAASGIPMPINGQGLTFLLYSDPSQDLYLDLLRYLYPGGTVLAAVDDRRPYYVSAEAMRQIRGVLARPSNGQALGTVVTSFGVVPIGMPLPSSLVWQAGVRFGWSATYRLQLRASHPARLSIDGVEVASTEGGAPEDRAIQVARGVHFVQVSAQIDSVNDRVSVARSDPVEKGTHLPTLHPISADESYAPMDTAWGLLGQVTSRGSVSEAFGTGPVADRFLDSTVAATSIDDYVRLGVRPCTVTWSGTLKAIVAGAYGMAFVTDGSTKLWLDGKPVDVASITPDRWSPSAPGTQISLAAGEHPVQLVVTFPNGSKTLMRWLWSTPARSSDIRSTGGWTIVPPDALRPTTPVWVAPPLS